MRHEGSLPFVAPLLCVCGLALAGPAATQESLIVEAFESGLNSPDQAELRGFVDLHSHPMSHLGFGGRLMHGAPDLGTPMPAGMIVEGSGCSDTLRTPNSMLEALGSCVASHSVEIANSCHNLQRHAIVKAVEAGSHSAHGTGVLGFPTFDDWPRHSDVTHQLMWIDWVKRAYDGGLRVLVGLVVNSETLADALNGSPPYDDSSQIVQQLQEMRNLVGRYEWMEVAETTDDLERIVGEDRLAVVLGIEVDAIGGFNHTFRGDNTRPTDREIRAEIRRLHFLGVRYIFPVHLIDNVFGGTAAYQQLFNIANRNQWGRWWELRCADRDLEWQAALLDFQPWIVTMLDLGFLPTDIVPLPKGCDPADGHQNIRGLQRRGRVAVRQMMRLGMIIDIDHASRRTADQLLDLAEEEGYPLVSGHNGLIPSADAHENQRTHEQYQRIAALGGMVGVGFSETNAQGFLDSVRAVREQLAADPQAAGANALALGTDINGLAEAPIGPCPVPNLPTCRGRMPVTYGDGGLPVPSMQTRVGNRTFDVTWDYNTDGVAHYGLLPDFLHHVELLGGTEEVDLLLDGAESFARVWRLAEATGAGVDLDVQLQAVGQDCDNDADCLSGRCDRGTLSTRTSRCIARDGDAALGDFCTHTKHCARGLTCDLDPRTNLGLCVSQPDVGEDCSDGKVCADGRHCDATGYCRPNDGEAPLGGFCSHNAQCSDSATCALNSRGVGVCTSRPGLGQDCSRGKICSGGRLCDPNNKCKADDGEAPLGGYCSHNEQCSTSATCALDSRGEGICTARPGLGEDCRRGKICAAGRICDPNDKCKADDGEAPLGGYCSHNEQCSTSATCALAPNGEGICTARPGLGQDCSAGKICAAGRHCDSNDKCKADDGEAPLGGYCSHNEQCSTSATCALAPNGEGVCTARPGLGEDCSAGKICAAGRHCDSNDKCKADDGEAPLGGYCSHNEQCATSATCSLGTNGEGICTARPGLGDDCSGGKICAAGRICDPHNRCKADDGEAPLGEYCSHNEQCSSSATCDLDSSGQGTCISRPGIGGDCSRGKICAGGRRCDGSNHCTPGPNEGEPGEYCSNDNQCLSGHQCLLIHGDHGICS